jgi:hypothetical protein
MIFQPQVEPVNNSGALTMSSPAAIWPEALLLAQLP